MTKHHQHNIRKTSNGKWYMDIFLLGRRYRKTFATEDAAKDCLDAIKAAKDQGMSNNILNEVIENMQKRIP